MNKRIKKDRGNKKKLVYNFIITPNRHPDDVDGFSLAMGGIIFDILLFCIISITKTNEEYYPKY